MEDRRDLLDVRDSDSNDLVYPHFHSGWDSDSHEHVRYGSVGVCGVDPCILGGVTLDCCALRITSGRDEFPALHLVHELQSAVAIRNCGTRNTLTCLHALSFEKRCSVERPR